MKVKSIKIEFPQEMLTRQRILEGEIQANEEENAVLQRELSSIYAEQDRLRDLTTGAVWLNIFCWGERYVRELQTSYSIKKTSWLCEYDDSGDTRPGE